MQDHSRAKLESFIDTLCHEMRNPLNGISGNVVFLRELLEEVRTVIPNSSNQSQGPRRSKTTNESSCHCDADLLASKIRQMEEFVEAIDKCVQHQRRIVNDALDFSKLDANQIHIRETMFDPNELVNSVVTMFHSQFLQKQLEITVEGISVQPQDGERVTGRGPILLKGDRDRITQVLINLVSNALKFTNKGYVRIHAWLENGKEEGTQLLHISVEDTGIGMSEEEASQVFERFFQANNEKAVHGTGLGLCICRQLVELMGGNISVKSRKGMGSTFSFYVACRVPTQEEKAQHLLKEQQEKLSRSSRRKRKADDDEQQQQIEKQQKRVMIVEDNIINQQVLTRYLKNMGYSFQCANNGQEAVDLFEQSISHPKDGIRPFDFILMDTEMPVLNGIEATRAIRQLERSESLNKNNNNSNDPLFPPPVIIGMSGNAREEHVQEALEAGMQDYLTKPYDLKDLSAKLERWMEGVAE
jgi:signal transduction histidine kinase/CheY-like chemotaxis protein